MGGEWAVSNQNERANMTPKQQELRRLLNLTFKGHDELEQAFREGADAVEALWSDEEIYILSNQGEGNFAESAAWTGRVIKARDEVIEELNNLEH